MKILTLLIPALVLTAAGYLPSYAQEPSEHCIKMKKNALAGDAEAQDALANDYANGRRVLGYECHKKDYVQAVKWYTKAAEQGNAHAQARLGFKYQSGEGVERDYAQGLKWLTRAWEQEERGAAAGLALAYRFGYGVEKDIPKAYMYFNVAGWESRRDGLAEKMTASELARAKTLAGELIAAHPNEEFQQAKKYALAGDPGGQIALAKYHKSGQHGAVPDMEQALHWYSKAADQGSPYAQKELALIYLDGDGVEKDIGKAYMYYHGSFSSGFKSSMKDRNELVATMSTSELARAKQLARNWIVDHPNKRFQTIEQYAKAGDPKAQTLLARYYWVGMFGAVLDNKRALKWITKAAEQGHAEGQYFLGLAYMQGTGVVKDYATAHMYSNLAASNEYDKAKKLRAHLEKQMPAEQLAEAQKLAREWVQAHSD